MIVSFNFYYAHPGLADAVLEQRLRASEVRVRIQLPYGRVMRRTAGDDALPDVIWEQEFAEVGGHHADMAARAASPEFEAIRAGMRPRIRRFERPLFEVCGAAAVAAPARVVALDWIFCAPDKTALVLAALVKHADAGGRLLRLITPGDALPELIWQHDYADAESCARGEARSSAWRAAVKDLVQDMQASAWQIESRT